MTDFSDMEHAAREILDTRIESVRELVRSKQRIADAEAQLKAETKAYRGLYRSALKDGWTPAELRKLGVRETDASSTSKTSRKGPSTAEPNDG